MQWHDNESKEDGLEPLPPPPAPHAPPDTRFLHLARYQMTHESLRERQVELLPPQSPPLQHAHPLSARQHDDDTRTIAGRPTRDGAAIIHNDHRKIRRQRSIAARKNDPNVPFPSHEQGKASATTTSVPRKSDTSDASATKPTTSSSDAMAVRRQQQKKTDAALETVLLSEEEKAIAATEASARRHDLLPTVRQAARESQWPNSRGDTCGSALARAETRRVGKQLSAKWLQTRRDPSNRPRGPLERPEEQELRETLFRPTARSLLRSGVLFDGVDATRNATFAPMQSARLPVVSKGITGLAGCCFERTGHELERENNRSSAGSVFHAAGMR
ncbi:unnamed protein product [Hyaloperonospora brassicae]|uniref:Uncharacterized protein n=1 Tax=Hyaloperonospora brassicae TaxID=162125 RepID=A0AAV0V4D4_HYABA|nr:unnamed protein product [Hyaloperonospora brassicae]